jgi:hypothetical protein
VSTGRGPVSDGALSVGALSTALSPTAAESTGLQADSASQAIMAPPAGTP